MVGISISIAPARSCSSRTICSIFLQDAEAERQPGVDAGGGLADQPGAQHQLVADDLGVGRAFLEDGQETAGNAQSLECLPAVALARRLPYGGGVAKAMRRAAPSALWPDPTQPVHKNCLEDLDGDKARKAGLAFQLKGADEQSSRRTPGSATVRAFAFAGPRRIGNDPGVMFYAGASGG